METQLNSRRMTMDEWIKLIHLTVGERCGRDRTCGHKIDHGSEENAIKVATKMNIRLNKRHDVEPYPCYFCKGWHVGRKMGIDELLRIAKEE
jgi:hypothetical protein